MSAHQYVEGWASSGHCLGVHQANAVMTAPDATSAGLVSWAVGQIQQLNVLLNCIGTARHDEVEHDPGEICGAIRHQLQQVEAVLLAVTDRFSSEQRGDAA